MRVVRLSLPPLRACLGLARPTRAGRVRSLPLDVGQETDELFRNITDRYPRRTHALQTRSASDLYTLSWWS